jgi:uncharacterized protein (TIGR03435 family)
MDTGASSRTQVTSHVMKTVIHAISIAVTLSAAFAEEKPAFEVATIKLAAPNAALSNRMNRVGPNRISIPAMTLLGLIYTAYGEGMGTSVNVSGGPGWLKQTAYAVEAQASRPAAQPEFRAMLRTLLEDRFQLKLHMDTVYYDIYALVIDRSDGKLGPNVRPWDGTCSTGRTPTEDDEPTAPRCASGFAGFGIFLDGATMISAAEQLSLPQSRNLLGRVVQDRTGLTGRYSIRLAYRFPPPGAANPAAPPDTSQPSLFTAVREQWGLKLEPSRGPFKMIVVDDAQRPTEN